MKGRESVAFLTKALRAWLNDEIANLYECVQSLAVLHQPHQYPLPTPTSIALEGGGPRGRLYIGAFEALEELKLIPSIKTGAGTSAGAIFLFMAGLGFNARQVKEIAENINFLDLMDYRPNIIGNWLSGTWLNKIASLTYQEYLHSGDIFHAWGSHLTEEILGNPHASFADLHAKVMSGEDPLLKDLIFTAVHAKKDTIQVFSYETTPNVRIADALQASMTLPGVFQIRIVKNKDGSEFGRFVDGGVRINNPVNLLDKSKYTHPNYPLQSTFAPHENTAVNPSAIGLSLSWLYKLDPTVTPIGEVVKKEIDAYKKDNALLTSLQSRGRSFLHWLHNQKSRVTQSLQHYKYKYWKYYDLGDMVRHILSFNVGLPKFNKEDRVQKLKDHFPNTIQIWNLDILPHETEFTEKQKQRADIVGRETVYSWWDTLHRPSESYQGQYHNLSTDYDENKLEEYLREFILELEKYENPRLSNRGFRPDELSKNIKLLFLSFKMSKILQVCPSPQVTLLGAVQKAKAYLKEAQSKTKVAEEKRECYLEKAVIQKLMQAIVSRDNEKFKRAYYAQLGSGLSRLTKPITKEGYNLLHYIILEGESTTLEMAFSLAKESIQQAIQQGKKPVFSSMKEFFAGSTQEILFELAAQNVNPRFSKILKEFCPEFAKRENRSSLTFSKMRTSFAELSDKVKQFSQQAVTIGRLLSLRS